MYKRQKLEIEYRVKTAVSDCGLIRSRDAYGGDFANSYGGNLIYNGGYFTIEAAIVGSIACFLVFAVMIMAMYIADLGITGSFLEEQMVEFSMDEDTQSYKGNEGKEELTKRLNIAKIDSFSVKKSGGYTVGKVQLSVVFPIPLVGDWLGKQWSNTIRIRMENGDNGEKMRRWNQLE